MIAYPDDIAAHVMRVYADSGDVPFDAVLGALPGVEDDEDLLADLIDADARARLDRDFEVSLERYLEAVPDLTTMPIALDAAIEFALRGLSASTGGKSRNGSNAAHAIESLITRFPSLEAPIRTASMLNSALHSTDQLRTLATDSRELPLPLDYGPIMPDGRSRYELRSRIGRGAHGSVYLAADRHLSDEGRPAYTAIKILMRGADHTRVASVREEAARARRVEHPSIVRVQDRGVDDDGRGYIVYQFVDGPSLRDWLAQRPTPPTPRHCASLVSQIAHGVQAAHAAGVVHCDLKPDNILMARPPKDGATSGDGRGFALVPMVADFGLAVCLETARAAAQRNAAAVQSAGGGAAVWGSLGFVAPEQYRADEGALAPPADVYALGGILYFLLTGRIPNGQSPGEVKRNLQRIDGEIERDQRGLRFDRLDPDLEAICRRALELNVKDRYASAEAFALDLEAWIRREPLRWLKPTPVRRLQLFAARQPRTLALMVILSATIACGTSVGVWWRTTSLHQLQLAQMEGENRLKQARFDAAKKFEEQNATWYKQILALSRGTIENLTQTRGGSLTENWLANLTILESIFGRGPLLAEDGEWWTTRIERTEAMVNAAREGGVEPEIMPLLWESALGFWMLNDGNPARAAEVLARNRASWSKRTTAEDPWLAQLECIEACATARQAFAEHAEQSRADGPGRPAIVVVRLEELPELERAIRTLEREHLVFTGSAEGGAAHRVVLKTLYQLFGPGYLNRPDQQRQIADRLNNYID